MTWAAAYLLHCTLNKSAAAGLTNIGSTFTRQQELRVRAANNRRRRVLTERAEAKRKEMSSLPPPQFSATNRAVDKVTPFAVNWGLPIAGGIAGTAGSLGLATHVLNSGRKPMPEPEMIYTTSLGKPSTNGV